MLPQLMLMCLAVVPGCGAYLLRLAECGCVWLRLAHREIPANVLKLLVSADPVNYAGVVSYTLLL